MTTNNKFDGLEYFSDTPIARHLAPTECGNGRGPKPRLREILNLACEVDCDQGAASVDGNADGPFHINATVAKIDGAVEQLIQHPATSEVEIEYLPDDNRWYRVRMGVDMDAVSEWGHDIRHVTRNHGSGRQSPQLVLDADPCPKCGSVIVNATIAEEVQFVGMSGAGKEKIDYLFERDAYQADDGPHSPRVSFARCGDCGEVLYEEG